MDWITQKKTIKWAIGILLIVNILTISIIWMLVTRNGQLPPFDRGKPPIGIEFMERHLNLTFAQTEKFKNAQKIHFDEIRTLLKQLEVEKNRYFEELVREKSDSASINDIMLKIHNTQMEVEKLRFWHFKYLLSICTVEQKEKFAPILQEFFIGIPPHEKGKNFPNIPEKEGIRENPSPQPKERNPN